MDIGILIYLRGTLGLRDLEFGGGGWNLGSEVSGFRVCGEGSGFKV